jgi:hypothetical protein
MSEPALPTATEKPIRVVVTGINVSFGDLMSLLFQLFFASIPVGIFAGILWYLAQSFLSQYGL